MRSRLLILSALLVSSFCAEAQEKVVSRFSFLTESNPAFSLSNPAFMSTLNVKEISNAELNFDKRNGGLVGAEGSDNSWNIGAKAESFARISDRIVLFGKLSYSHFKGMNMGGPIFLDPSYNPVNFYESTDTTIGVKIRETYQLSGGMAYSLNDRWALGAKINYEAADQAKRKDPRFLNTWMDLDLKAGVSFTPSDKLSLGLDLDYRKTFESVFGGLYGSLDRKYYAFIDYGASFGRIESLDGNYNYVLPSSPGRPMLNHFLGGSLQVIAGEKTKFFNELSFLTRNGYYGSKASSSVKFSDHDGILASYNGTVVINSVTSIHKIKLSGEYTTLNNNENSFTYETPDGGTTVIKYLGQQQVLERSDITANLGYDGWSGVDGLSSVWQYGALAKLHSRTQTTTLYPFFRKQDFKQVEASAYGLRNFIKANGMFSLRASAGFFTGFGTEKEDGTLASSSSSSYKSSDVYLHKQFEYETASRIFAGLMFQYSKIIKEDISAYINISYRFSRLLAEPDYLSDKFNGAAVVTIGCSF